MKCPKCGSELIEQIDQTSKKKTSYWFCEEHRILYTTKEVYEFQHHQLRLDKVLSKFEDVDGELMYKNWLGYDRNKKHFWFNAIDEKNSSTYESTSCYVEPPLDTVESLLNDLGVDLDE